MKKHEKETASGIATVQIDSEVAWDTQVVTCSGVSAEGSLRVVRNGIGLAEAAAVELSGVRGLWALRAHAMDAFDTFLVLTFVGETRLLALNAEDELDEAELAAFDANAQVGILPKLP